MIIVGTPERIKELTAKKLAKYATFHGQVNKDGTWLKGPSGWLVQPTERFDPTKRGEFKIVHPLNTLNYSISCNLKNPPGRIDIKELGLDGFTVQTYNPDGEIEEKDFEFVVVLNAI